MNSNRWLVPTLVVVASCSPAGPGCEVDGEALALHDDVREASGIALSRAHRDVVWTHNDSNGGAAIFALDVQGASIGRVELAGAHNRDWEDIAVARCPSGGPDGDCVFVADIGDNRATRDGIGIWIAAEPDPRASTTTDATFLRLHYQEGARDAEALVVMDDGSLLIVSKGREHPVTVYRTQPIAWPASDAEPIRLVATQALSDGPVDLPEQVTGASLGRDGTIAIRAYARLQFYRLVADTLEPLLAEPMALDSLQEPQGEGVAIGSGGRVLLISEAGPQAIAPRLTPLRCRVP